MRLKRTWVLDKEPLSSEASIETGRVQGPEQKLWARAVFSDIGVSSAAADADVDDFVDVGEGVETVGVDGALDVDGGHGGAVGRFDGT